MVKTLGWAFPDAEARKRGEQTGLETLVVHTLNGGSLELELGNLRKRV